MKQFKIVFHKSIPHVYCIECERVISFAVCYNCYNAAPMKLVKKVLSLDILNEKMGIAGSVYKDFR